MKYSKGVELIERIKGDLALMYPQNSSMDFIGSGNHGYAYKLENQVIKVTNDFQEATVAHFLKGATLPHIGRIYGVERLYFPSQDEDFYVINMELLRKSIHQSKCICIGLSDFKTVWFSRYGGALYNHLNYYDLCKIYMSNNSVLIAKVKDKLILDLKNCHEDYKIFDRISTEERIKISLAFFDFIYLAYGELRDICPNARIDLNEGNFMYDENNTLKCFDFQLYDESKIIE